MHLAVSKKIFTHFFLLVLTFASVGKLLSQPVANFSGTPVNGCAPLLVNFIDFSTGNPTKWAWDLGNGTKSSSQNPSTTYFISGKYKITLTVTNASGSNTIVKDQYINVYQAPVINFSANPVTGCAPLPVQFSDKSTAGAGTINSWKWDFGDGVISAAQNPKHTYASAGTFDVTLQVKNSLGCLAALSQPKYIKTEKVTANFSNNVQNSCKPPVSLNFKNISTGSSLTYKWNFGDGGTSSVVSPSHVYNTAGNYTVLLTATSASGCSNTLKKQIVIGTESANFSSPATICPGKKFSLINTSAPVPGKIKWYFGDGTVSDTLNPVKAYKNPGTYTIKMVADFGACLDSLSKTITVLSKQAIDFSAVDTTACQAPLTVNFKSNVPGATSVIWDFGDNTSSTDLNPSHIYTSVSSFDVSLLVTNSSGCQDTIKKIAFIKIQSPVVTLPELPLKDCIPYTHTFSSVLTSFDSAASYLWDFGDNTTSTAPRPTHAFNTIGSYDISVTVTTLAGCIATTKVSKGVKAGIKPTANFKATPLVACAITPINFTDLSTGNVDEWFWSFGDGKTSSQKNPVYRYLDTGYFTISLTARSIGCPSNITFKKYVYIKPPVAKFAVINNCKKPLEKFFSDSSKGADTWQWDFGDGNTSILSTPTHTYADTGTYTVSLTVTNFSTGCQHISTQQVYVITQKAQFTAGNTDICRGSPVLFKSQITNSSTISSYRWTFYDGGVLSTRLDTVSHTYSKAGVFDTRLIIFDLIGCSDTLIKPAYIKVHGPIASFKPNVLAGCVNIPVNFIDSSLSDSVHFITKWIWDYGDNIIETLNMPPFNHTYGQSGNFSIMLKVVDNSGCTDSISSDYPLIISKPVADFITTDTVSCPFKPINFKSLSTGDDITYLWNLGDGKTSTDTDPVHQYSLADNYTIGLKITDKNGCADSIGKKNYVIIKSPKADFLLSDSISACPPFFVTFKNNSVNFDSLEWDFGDGNTSQLEDPTHFYYIPGTYIVKLRAISPGGCYDEKTSTIIVRGPKGVLNYTNITGCNPLKTKFNASAKDNLLFIWDFNDGNTVKTNKSTISYTYTSAGFYLPKLILEDVNGCQVPIIGIDTIKVFDATAGFSIISKTICNAGIINFLDSSISNDSVTNYLWNFGDGTTSTEQNPPHNYSMPGQFTVFLIVTTAQGCKDTVIKDASAKIIASPDISISRSNNGCVNDTLYFKGVVTKPDASQLTWKWNFGNGRTSTQQEPPLQVYKTAGNYIVTAIATNSSGCTDTATLPITIEVVPDIDAGKNIIICQGKSMELQASGGVTYTWFGNVDFLNCINCFNPVTNTPDNKTYLVKGTNEFGCSGLDSVSVRVIKPFKITVSPKADSICTGQTVNLKASNAENYLWTPSSGLSNITSGNSQASPVSTTTYKVLGYDSNNCFKDSAYIKISVFEYPKVDAGPDKNYTGSELQISPTYSNDVNKWLWTPVEGLSCSECPAPMVMPRITTTYTVQVKNRADCAAVDNVTIFVNCNNQNIFIPNSFSPNNDGVNDVFYPRGVGINKVRGMKIFNRWGQVLFEKSNFFINDPASGWNGTAGNTKFSPDVYTYIIDVICDNGNVVTQTGTITLIR